MIIGVSYVAGEAEACACVYACMWPRTKNRFVGLKY
jgi:hypothetical protein